MTRKRYDWSVLSGAAFLMATSAIGPGFLTQTAHFTALLGASFGFAILVSVVVDAIAQVNIWRVIAVAGRPAQEVANEVIPGLGHLLSVLVFLGGLAFNIGNVAGAGLGLNVLTGCSPAVGAGVSALIAIGIFLYKEAGKMMDVFSKVLGLLMIGLALFIAVKSAPPVAEVLVRSVAPASISMSAILTIVGGTVGGYITFAGAHRLLDAGIKGKENLGAVNRSALTAIGLASLMRVLLFAAAFGVISAGATLDPSNPSAAVFKLASGALGYKLFGLVMWSAAITSVVGSAYTSISFVKGFSARIASKPNGFIVAFIALSALLFLLIGKPVKTLVLVGAINGLILPLSLGAMLLAAHRRKIVPGYRQPWWLTLAAVAVVITMIWVSIGSFLNLEL